MRPSFGLLDNPTAQGVKRGYPAFQGILVDAELLGDTLLQLVGRTLVEGENENFAGLVKPLLQAVGPFPDLRRGLPRTGRGDQKHVVPEKDTGLTLPLGK